MKTVIRIEHNNEGWNNSTIQSITELLVNNNYIFDIYGSNSHEKELCSICEQMPQNEERLTFKENI